MKITSLELRTVYNSRVRRTVEAELDGVRAAAPSGASTGTHEAHCHVPDDLDAVADDLREALVGLELSQEEVDAALREVDGTETFEELGAAAVATSLAAAKLRGLGGGDVFPYPVGNLVGGGAHGGNTTIQEFLVIPQEAETFPEAMRTMAECYHAFREQHERRITGINDEGAYVTRMDDEETLEAVQEVAHAHGAAVGVDMAATEFYEDGTYAYGALGYEFDADEQQRFVERLVDAYDLVYVEDPFHEDEFERFAAVTEAVPALVVGDDVYVTQEQRVERGAAIGASDAVLVKPNQVGTVSGARDAVAYATDTGMVPVMSHRSGETCDPVIADLALAWELPLLKAGIAGIRTAKQNQLLRRWDADAAMAEVPWR